MQAKIWNLFATQVFAVVFGGGRHDRPEVAVPATAKLLSGHPGVFAAPPFQAPGTKITLPVSPAAKVR